jgi:hypothetical protein
MRRGADSLPRQANTRQGRKRKSKRRAGDLKPRSKNRKKHKKKEISLERLFLNIMDRKMTKSEREYFGLKVASPGERGKLNRKKQ